MKTQSIRQCHQLSKHKFERQLLLQPTIDVRMLHASPRGKDWFVISLDADRLSATIYNPRSD